MAVVVQAGAGASVLFIQQELHLHRGGLAVAELRSIWTRRRPVPVPMWVSGVRTLMYGMVPGIGASVGLV